MSDRVFTATFGFSLIAHLLLLFGQLGSVGWLQAPFKPVEVIYESEATREELRALQAQLARAKRETVASPAPSLPAERTQVHIPERPSLMTEQLPRGALHDRASVVDLTDVVDASRGDPVLLSYFTAVRDQIQGTANRYSWESGAVPQGLVYVSFHLLPSGAIEQLEILSGRSVPSQVLWEVALRIVKASAPFPPFPPSLQQGATQTIIIPLEFLLGS